MIKFTFITLFPEAMQPYLSASMMWKAAERGLAEFNFANLREFGLGPHKSVDDTPYGGGDGMLMRVEPAVAAIESVKKLDKDAKILLPTPAGVRWTQRLAEKLAGVSEGVLSVRKIDKDEKDGVVNEVTDVRGEKVVAAERSGNVEMFEAHYVIFCPRYEGVDERVMEFVDLPICVGEFVVTGGELPALIIADSIVRLIPGVLGGENSAAIESFSKGDNLEFPQWTKPYEWRGMKVPDILLSGNHGEVDKWRAEQAAQRKEEIEKKWKI